MIALLLDLKTAFACPCVPGEKGCPYCKGEEGAIPNLNRGAILRAKEILEEMNLSPVRLVEMGYLPNASNRKRFCTGPLDMNNTVYLAEGENGEALLVLIECDPSKLSGYPQTKIQPEDALCKLPEDFYPAMDLPPIEWPR